AAGAAGPVGVTGSAAANRLAAEADVVIAIGTRYTDFTTASGTLFENPAVRFVNVNVTDSDAAKSFGPGRALPLTGDAHAVLTALDEACGGWWTQQPYYEEFTAATACWHEAVD